MAEENCCCSLSTWFRLHGFILIVTWTPNLTHLQFHWQCRCARKKMCLYICIWYFPGAEVYTSFGNITLNSTLQICLFWRPLSTMKYASPNLNAGVVGNIVIRHTSGTSMTSVLPSWIIYNYVSRQEASWIAKTDVEIYIFAKQLLSQSFTRLRSSTTISPGAPQESVVCERMLNLSDNGHRRLGSSDTVFVPIWFDKESPVRRWLGSDFNSRVRRQVSSVKK